MSIDKQELVDKFISLKNEKVDGNVIRQCIYNSIQNHNFENGPYFNDQKKGFQNIVKDFTKVNDVYDCESFKRIYETICSAIAKRGQKNGGFFSYWYGELFKSARMREGDNAGYLIESALKDFVKIYNNHSLTKEQIEKGISEIVESSDMILERDIPNVYGKVCTRSMMQSYIENFINNNATALCNTINNFSKEDCERSLCFARDVSDEAHIRNILSFYQHVSLGQRDLRDKKVEDYVNISLFNKFRECAESGYVTWENAKIKNFKRYLKMTRNAGTYEYFYDKRVPDIAQRILSKYKEMMGGLELTSDFLKVYIDQDRSWEELNQLFNNVYKLQNCIFEISGQEEFSKIINDMKNFVPKYMAIKSAKKSNQITSVDTTLSGRMIKEYIAHSQNKTMDNITILPVINMSQEDIDDIVRDYFQEEISKSEMVEVKDIAGRPQSILPAELAIEALSDDAISNNWRSLDTAINNCQQPDDVAIMLKKKLMDRIDPEYKGVEPMSL